MAHQRVSFDGTQGLAANPGLSKSKMSQLHGLEIKLVDITKTEICIIRR